MTDAAELAKRKTPLNLSIVHVDPEAFIAAYRGWLEITAFISALRAGDAHPREDGVTPALSDGDLANGRTHSFGNDTVMAFCMTAALKGDGAAVDRVETALIDQMGLEYPGNFALWHFRAQIDAPTTLADAVGQSGKKMLAGDVPPPPKRAAEAWETGLRFLEQARGSNFKSEIVYPLALWTREKWTWAAGDGLAFLAHIEDSLPILREGLAEPRNDEAFVADMLLRAAPAVEIDLQDEVQGMLRSVSRR